ncbi:MAG: ribonuclease R [Bacteroidales bacterium]|nr:ribonuclease R [Bacteroidales bacterium]
MAKSKKTEKKSSSKGIRRGLTKKDVYEIVVQYLSSHPGQYYSLRTLFKLLKFTTHPLKMLCVDVLNEMLKADNLVQNDEGEISFNGHAQTVEGVFTRTQSGRNYVDLPDGVSVSVYDDDTMHALPGDRVRVSLFAKRRDSNKLHGQVIEIVERADKPFIGTLQVNDHAAFLTSPDGSLPHDIFIPKERLKGGHDGDKALVRVTAWPERARNPYGEVVDVLGPSGDNNTEMHAILAEFGLPYKYPAQVEAAAERLDPGITTEEIAQREDFRDVTTFTIDPRDAKDFDDALSMRRIKDGVWEVGVHIADVSHYVLEGSVIDREAQQRATSVYLVDRTVPMLPERLCNFICSLRPDEEKLCFSVVFEMNEQADVLSHRIVHTVIRSDRRFAYEEVQYLLEQLGEASDEDLKNPTPPQQPTEDAGAISAPRPTEDFRDELVMLNRMAKQLREARMKHGAIDFDREEVRFVTDDKGRPLSVYFKRSKDANKLIEEFMLLANRTVAESVGKVDKHTEKPKTLPYRIHDVPDPGKLENLGKYVARFGMTLRTQGSKKDVAKSINRLLHDVKGQNIEELVETVTLRAMMKAKYSTVNIGHYGLAFDYYTHFTSPIRRYPDLMVHRLLTRYAQGAKGASQKKYESLCEHSSDMEQLAAQAERASIKYKQVEFMADKIGQEYEAKVTGMTDMGLYAEIVENHIEGFINVHFLGTEPFDFDERNFCLVGRSSHHRFTLGDHIIIRVAKANLLRKQLDFDFIRKVGQHAPAAEPQKRFFEMMPQKKGRKGRGK